MSLVIRNVIKNVTSATLAAVFTVCNYSSVAEAAGSADQCAQLLNNRTAAKSVQDWNSLESFSRAFLQQCKWLGSEDEAYAYGDISASHLAKGESQKALEAAQSCKGVAYNLPSCHLNEAYADLEMNRKPAAKDALLRARSLAQEAAKQTQKDLEKARGTSRQELMEAKLAMYQTQLHASELVLAAHGWQ